MAIGIVLSPIPIFAQDISSGRGTDILSGDNPSLIPPCINSPEESRDANASCITDSILFYTNILLAVVAISAFLYMLYGAFLYASAFGDEAKIGQAKKTVTHAIIGVILAGMSLLLVGIVRSVLGA